MKLINIGFGSMVAADRLLAIVAPDSAPIKRVVQEAKELGIETITPLELAEILGRYEQEQKEPREQKEQSK